MEKRLFVYGSLMDPKILGRVLHQSGPIICEMQHATLKGFERLSVVNATYPAISANPTACVDGYVLDLEQLWSILPEKSMYTTYSDVLKQLDRYEGSDYKRILVAVYTPTERSAFTYLWTGDPDKLKGPWNPP